MPATFQEYSQTAMSTHLGYPANVPPIMFNALCLAGEVGEMGEKIKKQFRDAHGLFNPADIKALMLECGDILWYLNRQAELLRHMMSQFSPLGLVDQGFSPSWREGLFAEGTGLRLVADLNIDKLASRQERGTIKGSGDER